jgi:two-component system, OmpR family, phosphate regulon sensor histidine kinase PhoR
MRRPSVRTLIVVPWVLLTLATLFLFLSSASVVTNELIAVAILTLAISIPSAFVVANTVVHAIDELRAEAARLARLRSSPVDPQSLKEFHLLRKAMTTATDELHSRVDAADLDTRRFRAVLESLTEGVIQLSGDGRFIHANQAARVLLHLPPQVEGHSAAALIRHPELRLALQQAAHGTSLQPVEITVDEQQLLISPRRVQLPGRGDIPGAIVGIVDLTQLRKLESVRRDFVANVSHELKTPLTSIRGYTETLLADSSVTPELRQQFLGVIHSNTDRLQRIIDNLLDISRLQSGGWEPKLESVDVTALAGEVVASIDEARRSHVEIEMVPAPALAVADAAGLRQVLSNILENAIRHTPSGGRIRIETECVTSSDIMSRHMIEITVQDTGKGIPRDALPRIFERFFRADAGRRRADGGTGLGLSIVKHLVDRMGGTVNAESELGKGTTIRVTLPAAQA